MKPTLAHLLWIPLTASVGFLAAFLFADLLRLPSGIYHLLYFGVVLALFFSYSWMTQANLNLLFSRRWVAAVLFGAVGASAMAWRVWSDPPSGQSSGFPLGVDLIWRGLLYGTIDGLLLSALPWIVTWRAFNGEGASVGKRVLVNVAALFFIICVTAAYHLGYSDFRGPKVFQAIIGNIIISLPTLLARNPLGSMIAHAGLHLAAVAHNPDSSLFLPPH